MNSQLFKKLLLQLRTNIAQSFTNLKILIRFVGSALLLIFGQFHWTPPSWLKSIKSKWQTSKMGQWTQKTYHAFTLNPRRSLQISTVALALLFSVGWGVIKLIHYYESLPEPDYTRVSTSGPTISNAVDGRVYGFSLYFSKSSAPIDQVGQQINEGITISPKINGTWTWKSDRVIEFVPSGLEAFKTDWLVGTEYKITFDKKLFPKQILLKDYSLKFTTPKLSLSVTKNEFYIDPKNEKIKKLVYNIYANQPVDSEAFKKHMTLTLQSEKSNILSKVAKNLKFNISFDKYHTEIYIESENIELPSENHVAKLVLAEGLTSKRGGLGLAKEIASEVKIAGIYDALKINSAKLIFARNEKYEPEQILVFESGVKLKSDQLAKYLDIKILPEDHIDPITKKLVKKYSWSNPSEITAKVQAKIDESNESLDWTLIPGFYPHNLDHSIRLKAPVQRYILLTVKKGLKGLGGYILKDTYAQVIQVPNYTPELLFMSEGSILTLSGEQKLSVLSRNVKKIKYAVARILPSNSNMLVARLATEDSFSKPYLYSDLEHSISEIFEENQAVTVEDEASTNYGYLDLNPYLKGGKGLFYIRAFRFQKSESEDSTYSSASYGDVALPDHELAATFEDGDDQDSVDDIFGEFSEEGENPDSERNAGANSVMALASTKSQEKGYFKLADSRLVMITDLGLIAKTTADKTTILYVQNLSTGRPVQDAKIAVLGKNGIAILETTTDEDGRASVSDLEHFINEKQPIAFVARKNSDIAYLPYKMRDRQLSYSRFDVGGEYEVANSEAINAMLFSDRGIYRPGEPINIGILLRTQVLKPQENLPFTMTVTDPLGQVVASNPVKASLFGLKDFQFSTRPSSPTGVYTFELATSPKSGTNLYPVVVGSVTVRVEEFVPDKLKISAQINPQKKLGWSPLSLTEFSVTLNNLFGTPAENSKVIPNLTLIAVSPVITKFKDFNFINPNANLATNSYQTTITEALETTTTNSKGLAIFEIDFSKYQGFYAVKFSAEGFESQSGRSVSAFTGGYFSHLKFLLGYKADGNLSFVKKDDERKVELVALNSDFLPSAAEVSGELFLNSYVSSLVKQADGTYKYQSVKKEESIKKESLKLSLSTLSVSLSTATAGSYTYVFKDIDGNELNRFDYTVIGDTNLTRSLDRSAELQLTLNKETYADGEEIEVNIISPYAGSGLITLERESVYAQKWFSTSTNSTTQRIKIPTGFSGNGYINVTFLRASDSKEIYMSPLSYGVVPFAVNAEKQKINIVLNHPEKVKPGDLLEIKYSSNQPTSIILYGVDEGILQVANYKTPDPIAHYFKKRALQVSTYQLLDLLLPEYSLLKQSYATGGDGMEAELLGANLNPFKNKSLAPVVFWSGILQSGVTPKTFKYQVPDYFNGALKIFAVANATQGMGSLAQTTLSVADFVISPTPPRFVSPSDEFEVGVLISNQSEGNSTSESIEVAVQTNDFLEPVSDMKKTILIPKGRELGTSFKFKAKQNLGEATLNFTAESGKLASKLKQTLSVRPASAYITTTQFDISAKDAVTLNNSRQMYEALSQSRLQVSATPLAFGYGLSEYLDNYVYDCTEQLLSKTMPAVFMPELYAEKIKNLKNVKLKTAKERHQEILALLRTRQTSSGGFALYGGAQQTHEPVSLYVIWYLIEARDRGFKVPDDLLIQAKEFLNSKVTHKTTSLSEVREFAKSLYLQARLGLVPGNDLNFLLEKLNLSFKDVWKQDLTAIWLAGTYGLIQKSESGWSLLNKFKLDTAVTSDYQYFYDGNVRNSTLIYIVSKHFPEKMSEFMNIKTLETLLAEVKRARYNTFSAAQMIMALSSYTEYANTKDFPGSLKIFEAKKLSDGKVAQDKEVVFDPLAKSLDVFLDPTSDLIKIQNVKVTPFFYALSVSGFDTSYPKEIVKMGIEADRAWSSDKIKQGDIITVTTKIRSLKKSEIPHVVLVDLFPAGFEPILDSVEAKSYQIKSFDLRDDRIVIYLDLNTSMTEVKYQLKAVNIGRFNLPPLYSEAMYDKDIQYRGLAKKVEIN